MVTSQQTNASNVRRGILARPLDALVFLIPLIVFYELSSATQPDRVIAFDLMRRFFELFGQAGVWAPALGVIVILLATHLASGERWSVHWRTVAWMYVEAAALAVPLLALNWAIPLRPMTGIASPIWPRIGLSIGAGVYEELVFRLILISLLVMIGVDILRLSRTSVAVGAIVLSSLIFSAHHHHPIGMEPFDLTRFVFRAIAGGYLAVVFWYRGYGPAAGCHAAYNAALVTGGAFGVA